MAKESSKLKRWTRLLTIGLAKLEHPPVRVEARWGKGFHLLLTGAEGAILTVSFLPDSGEEPAFVRTGTTCMGYIGDRDASEQERTWLESFEGALSRVEAESGWARFLQQAAARPAVSLPSGARTGERISSGREALIRINTRCNAKCEFCSARGVLPDLIEDPDAIRAELLAAARAGISMVSFTGGEPTLRADLPGFIAAARQAGIEQIDLQTNGVLLARERVLEPMVDAGLTSIFLSLHSADPAVHDRMLGIEGAFEKAVEGALACRSRGVQVRFNCVLTKLNLHGVVDLVRFIVRRFPGEQVHLCLSFIALQGWALDHPGLVPRIRDAAPAMARAIDVGREHDMDIRIPGLCGIPLCTLPGYEEWFDEFHDRQPPQQPTRSYPQVCKSCSWRDRCSGFWTAYIERFGDEEFGT